MSASIKTMNSKGALNTAEFVQMCLLFVGVLLSAKIILERLSSRRKRKQRIAEMVDVFPGPYKYPVFGNMPQLIYVAMDPPRRFAQWLKQMHANGGESIARFWIGNKPKIAIACPETAFKLYQTDQLQGKSSEAVETSLVIGAPGLIAIPAHLHTQRRKMWNSGFTRKQVEHSIKYFRYEAFRLRTHIEQYLGNDKQPAQVFDMTKLGITCTFRAICYSAFGEEYMNRLSEQDGVNYLHDIATITVHMTARIFKPWLHNDFIFLNLTKAGWETKFCIKRGQQMVRRAVKERIQLRQSTNWKNTLSANNNYKNEGSTDNFSFLDHLLDLHDSGYLSMEDVIAEAHVFVVAGYDTTGLTISYVLYFLSLYPEHQDKVISELLEIINSSSSNTPPNEYVFDAGDTKRMKHLDLCIKETLRLYPILPVSPRQTVHDTQLPDGRVLPGGVDVYVMLNLIQRNPKYFPDPDAFIPERHLQPNLAFMPFTLGSRNCIGQVYAMYKLKVVLSYLLLSYRWETTEKPGFEPLFQTLLVPGDGIHFKISKRNI